MKVSLARRTARHRVGLPLVGIIAWILRTLGSFVGTTGADSGSQNQPWATGSR